MADPKLTSDVKDFYYKPLPGMNNKVDELELGTKWVKKAQNVRFDEEPGSVTKRERISYFNSSSIGSGAMLSLYRYYTSGGVKKWIGIHGTTAYVGSDSAGTWTSIRTSLTTGKKASMVTYKDLLIVSNGYDNPWVYDGSSDNVTWELGACKVMPASGGSLDASATYKYQITINADVYICGAVSNTLTTTVTNKTGTLTNIPLGPAGTTNRKIFRTEGGGSTYKLLATISDNTTTTYTDTTADTSLGATIGGVTDDMPLGSILKVHRERLFITRDPSYPNRIYFSNVYLPHYISQTVDLDYMDVEPNDNDEIMGIPLQLGVMCCIKKNSIRKLHITSPVSGADPNTWYAEDPIVFSGSPAQWSIQQSPEGIIYLGWDHWYVFNGAQSIPIIDEFDTNKILTADYLNTVGYYDPKGIFLAAYTDSEAAEQQHDRVMRYNFKRNTLCYDLIGVNCFGSKSGDDEFGDLYYGDSANGYAYKTVVTEITYQLRTKSECNNGTKTNIFVGGTEASPYIEIGSTSSASAIPDNICIFWDDSVTAPSTGWTEITTLDDKFVKIENAAVGGTGTIGISSGTETTLDYMYLRCFKKNGTTTEYTFPDGAIVMWDQTSIPSGYTAVASGKHIVLQSTLTDVYGSTIYFPEEDTGAGENLDNFAEFQFIKKIGEQDTWNGVDQYVYCPYYAVTAPGNDWSDVSSTYDDYFLRSASSEPATTDGGALSVTPNYVRYDSTWHSTGFGVDYGTPDQPTGTEEDVYDNDLATAYHQRIIHQGDGNCQGDGTSTHTWDDGRTCDSIYFKFRVNAHPWGNYPSGNIKYKTEYRDEDGNWQTLADVNVGTYGDFTYTLTYTNSGDGYTGVTGVRAYIWGTAYSYEGNRAQEINLYFYEIKASGLTNNYATFHLAKKILGKMQDYNAAISVHQGTGTWVSPAIQINAESLDKLYWNETLTGTDDAKFYTRVGTTKTICEAASYHATALTNPNGSVVNSTANVWFQYKVDLTAADTTANIPQIYFTDGYVVRLTYLQATANAETTVEMIYQIGLRNFDTPMIDKIFKKIVVRHEGTTGSFTVAWATENSSGNFLVDLQAYPKRWDAFFPDDAMGKELDITISKNDAYAFKLKELGGAYSPEPTII